MTGVRETHGSVAWQPWSGRTFARARDEGRRVLLSLGTAWSEGCQVMAADVYTDPRVIAAIDAHYLPIRVDADERPDVADRYSLGGLPTTAILDADGALLGGGTYVPAARLHAALARLAVSSAASAPPVDTAPALTPSTDAVIAMVEGLRDDHYGGCGVAPKFPHAAAVRLALRDGAAAHVHAWALRTLDAIGWGALSDDDGGFFRYCEAQDWSRPRREKLLGIHAELVELFLLAHARGLGDRFLARARTAVAFIERRLRRPDGAWRTAAVDAPMRVLIDANAQAASALLLAARALEDAELGRRVIGTLEDLLLSAYRPGDGVTHCGGGVRGLLSDNLSMAAACLDAWDAAGQPPHRMMAEELVQYALRVMWDTADGGFFDRAAPASHDDPPAARRPLKPFVLNCTAAVLLQRLTAATGDELYSQRARQTLAAAAPAAMAQGADAAHYALATAAITG